MTGISLPIRALRIFFLQLRGVRKHDAREIRGGRRAEDAALEALRDQPRQIAAVIEMRVRQDDRLDRVSANGQRLPVALAQVLQSLKQPAIDEDAVTVHFEEMFRSSHRAGRTQERQRHQFTISQISIP